MYVDAKLIDGRVHVSYYNDKGERKVSTHLPPYVYYYHDKFGTYNSVLNDKLKKASFTNRRKFQNDLARVKERGMEVFESDVPPVFRLLEERFPTNDTPPLKVSILDIDPTRLRYVHDILGGHVTTVMSNRATIEDEVPSADLVISTVLIPGARAPKLLTRNPGGANGYV